MASKNDKVILELQKQIKEKKLLLNKTQKFVPITNCSFPINGSNVNLHVADKETLLRLIAYLKSMELGLKYILPEEVLTFNGFTSEQWLHDVLCKFNNLNISSEKERLSELEKKLHNLLSVDTKVSLEIENLKKSI
jgi:hypothetical protein